MIFQKPVRQVDRVFLHCSASDNEALAGDRLVREIHAWHVKRRFAGIAYHFVIDKEGQVLVGRSIEATPAAQQHHNRATIAICVHGLAIEKFTAPALSACLDLCREINRAYEGKVSFHGHREVAAKECPVFDYRSLLQLDAAGRMPLAAPSAEADANPQATPAASTQSKGAQP